MDAIRWSLLARPLPPLPFLLWSSLLSMALFALGAAVFRRTESRFADVI
jgi:ABC-type polysaccharide/polyol phosphate export permease